MPGTMDERLDTCSLPDIEGTDPFGRIEFMAGDRKQIHPEKIDLGGYLSGALGGIGVEENSSFAAAAAISAIG